MDPPKRAADPAKRATALAAALGWLLSLAAARGVTIDPDIVLRLDRVTLSTLSLRVVERLVVSLSRPLVSGAAALMEVLSRVLLLLLALLLCAAPTHREAVLQRARSFLREHVEVAVRCARRPSIPPALTALQPNPTATKSSGFLHRLSLRLTPIPAPPQALAELPTGAPPNVLVVGAAGVGKSALIGAMGSQAEEHGLELAAAEGLPSGHALEAYAKVARTPALTHPAPSVSLVEELWHAVALPALAGTARRGRLGGRTYPTSWRIRAAICGADASRRGQPVAVRGGGVQQDGRCPLPDALSGWCARGLPPRVPHSTRRTLHTPRVPLTHPRMFLVRQSLAMRSRSLQ